VLQGVIAGCALTGMDRLLVTATTHVMELCMEQFFAIM
jgi:hypothetical protein